MDEQIHRCAMNIRLKAGDSPANRQTLRRVVGQFSNCPATRPHLLFLLQIGEAEAFRL
jgi:hypothetical protein